MTGPFFCYIIAHTNGRSTYNGYTNNLERRLRQHNGEIKGGAKATTRLAGVHSWEYIATLTSPDWTAQRAMQHEWTIKYPTRRRPRPAQFQGPSGRIASLAMVLPQIPESVDLTIHPDYKYVLNAGDIPANIKMRVMVHTTSSRSDAHRASDTGASEPAGTTFGARELVVRHLNQIHTVDSLENQLRDAIPRVNGERIVGVVEENDLNRPAVGTVHNASEDVNAMPHSEA